MIVTRNSQRLKPITGERALILPGRGGPRKTQATSRTLIKETRLAYAEAGAKIEATIADDYSCLSDKEG